MAESEIIKLNMLGLPVVQTVGDFSRLTHISKYTIYQLSYHADHNYRTFVVPKKSGGKRVICQPSKKLKGLQSWILVNILNNVQVSASCKGFKKGSSTLSNALPHIGASTILNVDLTDFFSTVSSGKVYNVFKALGYNKLISTVFANICTFDGRLPQGSPCSPILANLATWTMDLRIQGYVGKRGITYTRYADDLSFSGLNPSKVVRILPMIRGIIEDEGFVINEKKTRVASSSRAKIVTGLIVNEDGVGIGRQKYKLLRAKIHGLTLRKKRVKSDEKVNEKLLNHIKGWLAYLKSVDSERHVKVEKYISDLKEKHPETLIEKL